MTPRATTDQAPQDDHLHTLRRHHRRLVLAGGGLLTLGILFALAVALAAQLRYYHASRFTDFRRASSELGGLLEQRDTEHQRLQIMAEYAWKHPLHALEGPREANSFRAENQRTVISAGNDALPQMVIGDFPDDAAPFQMQRYLQFAKSLSVITRVSPDEQNAIPRSPSFFIDAKGEVVILQNGLTERELMLELGSTDRASLFDTLRKYALLAPPVKSAHATPDPSASSSPGAVRHGIGPHPLAGKASLVSSFPLLDGSRKVGTFVTFDAIDGYMRAITRNVAGSMALMSPDGKIVLGNSAMLHDSSLPAPHSASRGLDSAPLLESSVTAVERIHTTDWFLVYRYDRLDILRDIGPRLVATTSIAIVVLGGLWWLLIRLDRRVFAPSLARAAFVFQSEQVSRALVEMSPVGLCLIDLERAAPSLENDLVRARAADSEAAGRSLYQTLIAEFSRATSSPAGRPEGREFELSVAGAEGRSERRLLVAAAPTLYQNRPVLLCALRDLTARVEIERRKELDRQMAEAANQAKTILVATISHEIRTPLQGIVGHLDLLSRSCLDASQRDRIAHIGRSADALLDIIGDVLELSRIESGEAELESQEFNPCVLLERVALLYAPLALAKGVQLHTTIEADVHALYSGAPRRVEQVLRNLVSNAVKFTASGRIAIRLSASHSDEGALLQLDVADSGIGITQAQCERLFEPFVQADISIGERFGGSGLGLSLCRRLVTLMGGHINVQSTPGVGSVFRFVVPVGLAPTRPSGYPQPLLGRHIAVLASAHGWRNELGRRLRAWGAKVTLPEAPDWLDDAVGHLDAVITFESSGDQSCLERQMLLTVPLVHSTAGGPLRAERQGKALWVSCYSSEAMLDAILQVLPRCSSPF